MCVGFVELELGDFHNYVPVTARITRDNSR